MKRTASRALIIITFMFVVVGVFGQQVSDVDELKDTIKKLESIARDETASREVRDLNQRFLVSRRVQLQALLQSKIKALQDYQAKMGSALTSQERSVVESSVGELKNALNSLQADMRSDSASGSGIRESGGPSANSEPLSANTNTRTPSSTAAAVTRVAATGTAVAPPLSSPDASVPIPRSSPQNPLTPAPAPPLIPHPECALWRKDPKTFSLVDQYICSLVKSVKDKRLRDMNQGGKPNPTAGLELENAFTRVVIVLVAKKERSDELVRAEEARVDKQVGGGSANAGSTSLVTKGNVPAILGFAVENGGLAKDTNGTSITFRGNPVGIFKTLANQGLISGFDRDDPTTRFLRRTSFAFTFDTSRGQNPGVFTGKKQQLSEVSARIVLYDKRDPRRAVFKKDWEDFLVNKGAGLVENAVAQATADAFYDTSSNGVSSWNDPAMAAWFNETQSALAGASTDQVEAVLTKQLDNLPIDKLSPAFLDQLAKFSQAFSIYLRDRNTILKKVGKAGVLTFDYDDVRNVNQPDLSTFKFIGEKGFYNGRLDLTGNGSFSMFNTTPVGLNIGRLRDAQAAFQLDGTFGSAEKTGVFVLSFAYKYQHLAENAFTQAGTMTPNTKGDISVGQLKLTVPIKGLGIKFPISVTFANRTELVKEKTVRGNFGFTFDLDTIFGKFKPF